MTTTANPAITEGIRDGGLSMRPAHVSASTPPCQAETSPAACAVEVTKVFGEGPTAVRALDGVSFDVRRGELTAIMGPSGSGKSTLLYCMAGLERVTSGDVVIDGVDISRLSESQLTHLRRDRLGFVFQAFNLVPTLTAEENIVLPLDIAHRKPDQGWLKTIIDTVGLRERLRHRPSELSGGQQQRVAAARALASRPAIIFADEPSGNLDSKAGAELLGFMRRSVDDLGQTIVMVTHDPNIATYADRVVFLRDGRIVGEELHPTADAILSRMKSLGG
jgi:putative ABC transport system ATP-binding protein